MGHLYLLLTIAIFTFQGCATKEMTPAPEIQHTKTNSNPLQKNPSENKKTENQIDEFEDEFSQKETDDMIDPLGGYNRIMTSFNDKAMVYIFNPISEAYAYVVPQPVRLSVSNFIDNIEFPIRFTNNLLQGKVQNSVDELERFLVNSTVGIGGLMDPATEHMQIPVHDEDFGQTLGHYGVGPGFHVVLPFIGPSNVRDIVGSSIDGYASPLVYVENLKEYKLPDNAQQTIWIRIGGFINKNSLHLGKYENLKADAIDLYPFFRDAYEQRRIFKIEE